MIFMTLHISQEHALLISLLNMHYDYCVTPLNNN